MNWAWRLRGAIDRLFSEGLVYDVGAVILVCCLRVMSSISGELLLADRVAGRLILYAEMKVPGEAWLEFQVSERDPSAPLGVEKITVSGEVIERLRVDLVTRRDFALRPSKSARDSSDRSAAVAGAFTLKDRGFTYT